MVFMGLTDSITFESSFLSAFLSVIILNRCKTVLLFSFTCLVNGLGPSHFSSGFPLSVLSELNQVEQEAPDT